MKKRRLMLALLIGFTLVGCSSTKNQSNRCAGASNCTIGHKANENNHG